MSSMPFQVIDGRNVDPRKLMTLLEKSYGKNTFSVEVRASSSQLIFNPLIECSYSSDSTVITSTTTLLNQILLPNSHRYDHFEYAYIYRPWLAERIYQREIQDCFVPRRTRR